MKMRMRFGFFAVLMAVLFSLPAWSQQSPGTLKEGDAMTVEGTITDLQMTPGQGPPFLVVKTNDGTLYTVHFGPIMALRRQGFEPALNNKVVVSGTFCCVVNGRTVIRSNRIVLEGKTFSTPIPPGDLSMLPPATGGMGQGMGMGMGMNMQGGAACANMPGGCPMMQQGGGMNMQGGGMGMGMGQGMMNMPQGGQTGTPPAGCCAQGSGMMMGQGMNMQGGSGTAAAMPGCPMMQNMQNMQQGTAGTGTAMQGCPMMQGMQQGGGMQGMGHGNMNMQGGQGGGMMMQGGAACANMPGGCPMMQQMQQQPQQGTETKK